jgi:protein-tyrosine phosphatase
MRLLMVCLGNICRSPLAEGALRARLDAVGLDWVEVDSAGTGGWHAGEPPDRRSIAVAAAAGVDIRRQRARQLHRDDYHAFDWLLCADHSVLRDVRSRAPAGSPARAALLLAWAEDPVAAVEPLRTSSATHEIPDPYTGGAEEFRAVWTMIDAAAQRIAERLARGGAGA